MTNSLKSLSTSLALASAIAIPATAAPIVINTTFITDPVSDPRIIASARLPTVVHEIFSPERSDLTFIARNDTPHGNKALTTHKRIDVTPHSETCSPEPNISVYLNPHFIAPASAEKPTANDGITFIASKCFPNQVYVAITTNVYGETSILTIDSSKFQPAIPTSTAPIHLYPIASLGESYPRAIFAIPSEDGKTALIFPDGNLTGATIIEACTEIHDPQPEVRSATDEIITGYQTDQYAGDNLGTARNTIKKLIPPTSGQDRILHEDLLLSQDQYGQIIDGVKYEFTICGQDLVAEQPDPPNYSITIRHADDTNLTLDAK